MPKKLAGTYYSFETFSDRVAWLKFWLRTNPSLKPEDCMMEKYFQLPAILLYGMVLRGMPEEHYQYLKYFWYKAKDTEQLWAAADIFLCIAEDLGNEGVILDSRRAHYKSKLPDYSIRKPAETPTLPPEPNRVVIKVSFGSETTEEAMATCLERSAPALESEKTG